MIQIVRIYKDYRSYLTRSLKKIGIPERSAQTKNVITFWMLGNWLHNRTINDNQMFWCRLDGSALTRITRIKEEGGALQTYPITFPTAFTG